jgi:hypothetical protein
MLAINLIILFNSYTAFSNIIEPTDDYSPISNLTPSIESASQPITSFPMNVIGFCLYFSGLIVIFRYLRNVCEFRLVPAVECLILHFNVPEEIAGVTL